MARPSIIALVGIDGSGKTTHAGWLADRLTSAGLPASYFENGGGRLAVGWIAHRLGRADAIELLGRRTYLVMETAVRWTAIARALAWSRLSGRVAVMDRYSYCQIAMMRTRGDGGERVVRALYTVFPRPDVVCFLEVSPAEAQRRVERRGVDTEKLSYLTALDAAYRSLPEMAAFTVVDAEGDSASVKEQLHALLGGLVRPEPAAVRR